MKFSKAKQFIIPKLKSELDPRLYYHGYHHTLDVIDSAEKIAKHEGIKGKDIILLKTAALFHDSGFLFVYKGHENKSVEFAKETLPRFNYSDEDIEVIGEMILATKIPQQPKTHLAQILCDADLDYIGRDDFEAISGTLFKEWKAYNMIQTEKEWYIIQVKFLESQFFHTFSSNNLREPVKLQNLNNVRQIYNKVMSLAVTG